MVQWCSNQLYREDLLRRRDDPHVRPINELVDQLRLEQPDKFIPYVAPTYGGTNARLLALLQDPGPKTNPQNTNGSGMLCIENDDESAARYKMFLADAGIDVCDMQAWNAFPWHVRELSERDPITGYKYPAADVTGGIDALVRLIALLPKVRVVLLHGRVAQAAWQRYVALAPDRASNIQAVETWHTSARLVNPMEKTAERIERVNADLRTAFGQAAWYLRGPDRSHDQV